MPLTRKIHWETRSLHYFLFARVHQPFAWGVNDCCLFPADAIEAFTGTDIAADFRGKYTDEASAFALIKTVTGSTADPATAVADAAAWCAAKHGLVEWQHPLMAQRGDLVVVENGGRLIAGIVHLNARHVVSMAESGPVKLKIAPHAQALAEGGYVQIKRAWRVGG